MRRRSLVGVLIWACTPFCVARAADSPAPVGHLATGADSSQPSPASSTLSVTVQGTRPPPRSASDKTIPHDVIAATPHRTGADTLVAVPGIFLTQHSGEGKAYQIFFRGFDAVHGQDLEIWAGGAPVNNVSNIHGQGYADLHFVMPEVIREIRATPGSHDPRQGDFAVAGTLRMRLGYAEPGMTVRAGAGSFGARRLFAAYRPTSESEGTFAAFEAYHTDGFGPSRAAERVSGIAQWEHAWGNHAQVRVLLSSYAGRFDSAGVLRLDEIETGRMDRFATHDARQGGHASRTQLVLEIQDKAGQDTWAVSPYFVRHSMMLRSDFTGFLVDPTDGDLNQQLNDASTVGMTGHYRKPVRLLSGRDTLEVGMAARSDWIEQSQRRLSAVSDEVTADLVDATIRATDIAGYVDAAVYPVRRVSVRGGVRVDGLSFSTVDRASAAGGEARASQGMVASKRGTVSAGLGNGWVAVVSYGEGFRSPQARSLADGQRVPFTTVYAYEAGLRWKDGDRWESSLAAYRCHLSDDLVFDHATGRNEWVPSTLRWGAAFDMVARPTRWLLSAFGATYTRASFAESDATHSQGSLLPYVPQVVARSELALTPSLGTAYGRRIHAHFGASSTLLARRPQPYAQMGHDVVLFDAAARIRMGEIETGVDVFNLMNCAWYDGEFVYASSFQRGASASLVPARHVSVGAPRTLMFTASLYL